MIFLKGFDENSVSLILKQWGLDEDSRTIINGAVSEEHAQDLAHLEK